MTSDFDELDEFDEELWDLEPYLDVLNFDDDCEDTSPIPANFRAKLELESDPNSDPFVNLYVDTEPFDSIFDDYEALAGDDYFEDITILNEFDSD
ncbi:MAG: hypothetical protein LBT38_09205 [Deltaproteobacteria bacterium]|jgi:hypothetical protein|nr:hypothetical protein [Deltaproteobacteria bacterium]